MKCVYTCIIHFSVHFYMYVCVCVSNRGEDNALLVWSEERGLSNPEIFPFPKLTQQGSGYLLPNLSLSVSGKLLYNCSVQQ